jgi:hypothetical protein
MSRPLAELFNARGAAGAGKIPRLDAHPELTLDKTPTVFQGLKKHWFSVSKPRNTQLRT